MTPPLSLRIHFSTFRYSHQNYAPPFFARTSGNMQLESKIKTQRRQKN